MPKTSVQHWSNIGSMSRVYCGRWDDTTSCLFLTPFIGPRHWGRLTVSSPGRSQFFGLGHLSRSCRHLRLFKPRLTALRQCAPMLPELRLVMGFYQAALGRRFWNIVGRTESQRQSAFCRLCQILPPLLLDEGYPRTGVSGWIWQPWNFETQHPQNNDLRHFADGNGRSTNCELFC